MIRPDWQKSLLPFVAVLCQDCELQGRLNQCSVTDAKSLYDTAKKNNPTSRQDRGTSVELAIIIDDVSNGALEQLME